MTNLAGDWLVLFDGVCGLCHGLVQFLIQRDRADRLRFAPLQGRLAAELLARHGKSPTDLNTVFVVQNPGRSDEKLRERADAVLSVIAELGGPWRLAGALRVLPDTLLNFGYACIARTRYRLFGRLDACPVPTAAQRAKFYD